MELRTLRALVEVVRHGGFSAAAKAINATQPTLSKAVRQFEDELGMVLLDRAAPRPQLTAAGEIVHRRALGMLATRADMIAELDELRGLRRGSLRLGLPPLGAATLFAPLFALYRSRYPGIDVRLVEHGSKRLEEIVLAGELEMVGSLIPAPEVFESQSVTCEPMMVVLPRDHPLATRPALMMADLAGVPLILFEIGFALNPVLEAACARNGFAPNLAARSGQIDFIVALVASGLGVGFLPQTIAEHHATAQVRLVRLDEPQTHWHMGLVWRRGAYLSHAARAWLELAREVYE